jgi:hypothetical protein
MHRMIDTATWDDPWFAELAPDTKLVFLYLLTNRRSTAAGAFEITIRHMAFETGIDPARVNAILAELHPRVQWWPAHQVIWIRNFFRHQAANDNFAKSARTFIAGLDPEVQAAIASVYPDLVPEGVSPDQPAPTTPTDTHQEPIPTGTDTHTEPVTYPSASNSNSKEGSSRTGEKAGADAPVRRSSKLRALPENGTAQQIVKAYCEAAGIEKPAAYAKAVGQAQQLANAGVTPEDIPDAVTWCAGQEWLGGAVDLGTILSQADKWRAYRRQQQQPNRRRFEV